MLIMSDKKAFCFDIVNPDPRDWDLWYELMLSNKMNSSFFGFNAGHSAWGDILQIFDKEIFPHSDLCKIELFGPAANVGRGPWWATANIFEFLPNDHNEQLYYVYQEVKKGDLISHGIFSIQDIDYSTCYANIHQWTDMAVKGIHTPLEKDMLSTWITPDCFYSSYYGLHEFAKEAPPYGCDEKPFPYLIRIHKYDEYGEDLLTQEKIKKAMLDFSSALDVDVFGFFHCEENKMQEINDSKYDNTKDAEMTSIKKFIRFTLINGGGEFTGGIIDNDFIKEKIREKISEGSVNSWMEFDGYEAATGYDHFDASYHTNILHNYGPSIDDKAKIIIEESYDVDVEDDNNRDYNEIFSGTIDEYEERFNNINRFTTSNPNPWELPSGFNDDDLVFYSQKIEKRIHYPAVIEIADGEEFNIENLYIGSVLMDETIMSEHEIIEDLLYIPTEKAKEYIREHSPEDFEEEQTSMTSQDVNAWLRDIIEDIYNELPELKDKIRNNHLIYPSNIEGKGEWENDFVRITSLDGEEIFISEYY